MSQADERIGPQYEYHLDLLRSDLGTLIEKYEDFETRVENDVFRLFRQCVEQEGAEPQGSLLLIDKIPHRVTVDQIGMDRSLTLYLIPWGETNPQLIDSSRRIGTIQSLRAEARAWNRRTNRKRVTINWRFDRKQARRKFKYKHKTTRS